jgi:hypothetical protein
MQAHGYGKSLERGSSAWQYSKFTGQDGIAGRMIFRRDSMSRYR